MRVGRILSRAVALASASVLVAGLVHVTPVAASGNANLHLSKTVSSAVVTPAIGLTLSADKADAIPGDSVAYSATVTNTGATLALHGDLSAGNTGATDATISSYWDAVSTTAKSHCGADPSDHGASDSQWEVDDDLVGNGSGHWRLRSRNEP